MTRRASRRRILRLTGVALAGTALAGCATSGSAGGDETATATPTATATATPASGGSDDGSGATATATVEMTDSLTVEPKAISVSSGTTVTWTNVGKIGHTVTVDEDKLPDGASYFASGGFESQQAAVDGYNGERSGNVPAGESFQHTFETPGTYEDYCVPHETNGMSVASRWNNS